MQRDYRRIPPHTMESLQAWVTGCPTGSFLRAVLCGDLYEACARADDQTAVALTDIVGWITNEAPADCWGSSAKVAAWSNRKRAERLAAQAAEVSA